MNSNKYDRDPFNFPLANCSVFWLSNPLCYPLMHEIPFKHLLLPFKKNFLLVVLPW